MKLIPRDWTPKAKKPAKPGTIGEHHIPIYDHNGHLRGRVGPKASSVTVARFTGTHGSELRTIRGRKSWVSPAPAKAKPRVSAVPLSASLKTAKGSVTHTPSAPQTHARPRR